MNFPEIKDTIKDKNLSRQSAPPQQIQLDEVNTSEPATKTITYDTLKKCFGFLRPEKIIYHFTSLSDNSVKISHIDKSLHLNPGKTASSNLQDKAKNHPPQTKTTAMLSIVTLILVQ